MASNKQRFSNQIPTEMDTSWKSTVSIIRDFIKGNPQSRPDWPIPVQTLDRANRSDNRLAQITWFGHSAVLLELDGKIILLDPMLEKYPSPVPIIGGKRYSQSLPMDLATLPQIDVVLLSHNHYDHLSCDSILRIKDRVRKFIVPQGLSGHLIEWGVDPQLIHELNWWDVYQVAGLELACTPARHFSGRSLFDRDATLWCSWVIGSCDKQVYFSGDSGYGPHFAEIGAKYGPFDLTLLECGQYDQRWAKIHMMPEETVQAHLDLSGKLLIPIHWSAFTLALHSWMEPVERVTAEGKKRGIQIATPKIGETVTIGAANFPQDKWWRERNGQSLGA